MKTSLTKILLVGNLLLLITAITLMAGCAYKEKQVVWEINETDVPSDTNIIAIHESYFKPAPEWLPLLDQVVYNEVYRAYRSYKERHLVWRENATLFPTDTSIIEIYELGRTPDQPFRIVGKVRSTIKGAPLNRGTEDKIKAEIKLLAAVLGADAVMGLYTSNQSVYEKMESGLWGSGLAINWMNTLDSLTPNYYPFFAAIRPWSIDSLSSRLSISYLGILMDAAQYYLEKKGYYSLIKEIPMESEDTDRFSKVDWNEDIRLFTVISYLYGIETNYVMLVNQIPYCDHRPESTFSSSNGNFAIRAMLLSKLEEKIVWENCLPVDIDFRSRIFEGGRSRGDYDLDLVQYYKIMEKLFQDLPIPRIPHSPLEIITKDLMLLPRIPYAIAIQSKLEKYREDYSARYYREMSATARLAPNMLLYDAVSRDDTLGARRALELGADINFLGYNQNTPLHTAAIKAGPAMVNFLLQNGAKQDLHNESGLTPLEITEGKGNFVPRPEIASILREFKTR